MHDGGAENQADDGGGHRHASRARFRQTEMDDNSPTPRLRMT
jgi:hypothetical protein